MNIEFLKHKNGLRKKGENRGVDPIQVIKIYTWECSV
jgi:hypothetical protein